MTHEDLLKNPNAFIEQYQALKESHAFFKAKTELLEDQIKEQAKELRQLKAMIAQSLFGRKSERDIEG